MHSRDIRFVRFLRFVRFMGEWEARLGGTEGDPWGRGAVMNAAAAVAPDRRKPISPAHSSEIAELARFVEREPAGTPRLVGPDNKTVALPEEIYRVLTIVVGEMRAGNAVSVVPISQRISTQEAAELLGISRPTLIRLLDAGEIPYDQPSRHRRLQLADVLAYREQSHTRTRSTLDLITAEASSLGLYEDEASDYTEALRAGKRGPRATD